MLALMVTFDQNLNLLNIDIQGPLLLTWINFISQHGTVITSIIKYGDEIIYPFPNFNTWHKFDIIFIYN